MILYLYEIDLLLNYNNCKKYITIYLTNIVEQIVHNWKF